MPHDPIAIAAFCLLFLRAWLLTIERLGLPSLRLLAMTVAVTSCSPVDQVEITHVDGQSVRASVPVCHSDSQGGRKTAAHCTK